MGDLRHDIVYASRKLRAAPAFTLTVILTLALGIGANTAIFSVVNAVLLRPLPFPSSERLMSLWSTTPSVGAQRGSASYPDFADWRSQNQVFEGTAAFYDSDFVLTGSGDPERLSGAVTSAYAAIGLTATRESLPSRGEWTSTSTQPSPV